MSRADAPPAIQPCVKVYSSNRRFYAHSLLAQRRTFVFRADASRTPLWEVEGYGAVLFLADDGNHLVEGYSGGNLLDPHVQAEDAFLTFFVKAKQVGRVSIGELFPHPDKLPHTASSLAWGNFWGFDSPQRFTVILHTGRKVTFDTDTGRQVSAAPSSP